MRDDKSLTDDDFARAAAALGCEVAAIRAVADVESKGRGFHADNVTPRILFEAHWFSALTKGVYNTTHPDISSPRWVHALYSRGKDDDEISMGEHKRLRRACALNREAALQSASWGRFQVMGFNWKIAGHDSLQSFINAMYRSEGAHLDCFVAFVKHKRLETMLRDHRWADFAFIYNGEGYKANAYDTKIAAAYRTWAAAYAGGAK